MRRDVWFANHRVVFFFFSEQLEKLLKQLEQEKVSRSRVEEEKKRLETEASHAQKALRDLQKAGTRQDQMARSRGKMTCIGYVSGVCLMLQLH